MIAIKMKQQHFLQTHSISVLFGTATEIIKNAWKRNASEFCTIESPHECVEWTKIAIFQAILTKMKLMWAKTNEDRAKNNAVCLNFKRIVQICTIRWPTTIPARVRMHTHVHVYAHTIYNSLWISFYTLKYVVN